MRRAWLIPVLLAFRFGAARAQLQGTLDVGAAHVSEAGVTSASGVSAGGTVDAALSRGWLRVSALGVSGSGLQSSVQALIAGALDLRESGRVRPVLGASGSFFTQSMLDHSANAELSAGARLARVAQGASVVGSAGMTAIDGESRPVYRVLADAWASASAERFNAELSLTSSEARFEQGVRVSSAGRRQQYVEFVGAWRHERDGLSFGLTAGARDRTSAVAGGVWGTADVSVWVAPRTALALAVGNSIEDVERGIPRTSYATATVRIAMQPHLTIFSRSSLAGPRMLARTIAEHQQIEVFGVSASRVEIMGDFTEWTPVELERAGTVWRLERRIVPGPHRVALRIDGGEWVVPSNLARVEDDLGGAVGVITVP